MNKMSTLKSSFPLFSSFSLISVRVFAKFKACLKTVNETSG